MYKDILLPIDTTDKKESWEGALNAALEFNKAFNSRLHILNVVSDYGMSIVQQYFPSGSVEEVLEKSKDQLHGFVKEHVPSDVKVQHIIGRGSVYGCIIETAEQIKADLILMSAHRPGLKDYLLGPNAAKVVRHSDISVLVLRDENHK